MNLYEIGSPDPEQFKFKDCVIGGDECVLINPKDMSVKWNDQNKYFRSSIWRKHDGKLISAGFRKFVNYLESPEFEPLPLNVTINTYTKLDGSLLIISKHQNELIVRTRGTVDASQLENGHEISLLKTKYPKAFDNEFVSSGLYSLLFEWTTPTNRIVLQETQEPTLWLIGMVRHEDYTYVDQSNLDKYAEEMDVQRPNFYSFCLSDDIDKLKQQIEPLKDIEGVVVYDETGQILKKIKTLRYLELHRVFTGIKSVNHLFDLFVEYGCTHRENFETLLATNYDWELVTTLKLLLDELYAKWNLIKNQVFWIEMYLRNPDFIELDRKGKAQKILELFPNCSGIAFALLDNKEITPQKLWNTFN
jgi:hypothetical protein